MRSLWKFALGLVIAAVAFLALLQVVALAMRPDVSVNAVRYDAAELAAVRALHQAPIDKDNPPILYQAVEYAADSSNKRGFPVAKPDPDWLDLPPVAERTGSEPLVLRGVDGASDYGGQLYFAGDGADMDVRHSAVSLVVRPTASRWCRTLPNRIDQRRRPRF